MTLLCIFLTSCSTVTIQPASEKLKSNPFAGSKSCQLRNNITMSDMSSIETLHQMICINVKFG